MAEPGWIRHSGILLLTGLVLTGCSQRESIPLAEENAAADQHLPLRLHPIKVEFLL